MRIAPLVVLSVLLLVETASAAPGQVVVQAGDTLTALALRHDVTVDDLRRWNGIEGDVIRIGQELSLRPPTRPHRIAKGDTLSRIAAREGTTVAEIAKHNPGLAPNRIRAGQTIRLPQRKQPPPPPMPVKAPLECPGRVVQLAKHEGYRLRHRDFSWATAQTADAVERGFAFVRLRHRDAPRVRVLDASRREGGRLGAHRSHRDGRDVDITYYQTKCGPAGCPLESVSAAKLDVARQWSLLRYWLENDDVEFLFIDHKLQRALYEHAKKSGVSEKRLDEWFQYPRPAGQPHGVIRHWEGHQNHVHVRFRPASCPDGCCRDDSRSARGRAKRERGPAG